MFVKKSIILFAFVCKDINKIILVKKLRLSFFFSGGSPFYAKNIYFFSLTFIFDCDFRMSTYCNIVIVCAEVLSFR